MKINKQYQHKVNICWELNNKRKCVTLTKNEAYATRKWVEDNEGAVFWFAAVK
jgi:hypothetical protein